MHYPTTDEIINPDGTGRRQEFQGAVIYWSPLTGAHPVYGLIKDKWAQLGWETGTMGYPLTDETASVGYWATRSQRQSIFVRGGLFYDGPTNNVLVGPRERE
jgi:uncharacterized protein with LGFP repeats